MTGRAAELLEQARWHLAGLLCRLFGHPSWHPCETIPYDKCRRCGELRLVSERLAFFSVEAWRR